MLSVMAGSLSLELAWTGARPMSINKRLKTLEQTVQPSGIKVFWQSRDNKDLYADREGNQYTRAEVTAFEGVEHKILVEYISGPIVGK
jgi:hypothetical protein